MSSKRISLSLNKVTSLLSNNGYILAALYCVDDEVVFIECRTPKLQRTFIINVPEKYRLVKTDDKYKCLTISRLPVSPTRQLDYLMEIKGPLLECDLVAVSSTRLALYRNNGSSDCFKFGGPDPVDEEDDDNTIDGVEIPEDPEALLKGVNAVLKKMASRGEVDAEQVVMPSEDIDNPIKEVKPEDIEEMKVVNPKPKNTDDPIVELEFEEETRNEVPGLGEGDGDDAEGVVDGESDDEADPSDQLSKAKLSSLTYRKDNALPPNLEEAEIAIGIIYVCIDLTSFYKRAATNLETEVLANYDVLETNEREMREGKVSVIGELCTKLSHKTTEILERFQKKEASLKAERLKLSAILDNAEGLRKKTESDVKKFADVKSDVDRIYTQTKTTLHELNIEILRLRDEVDDALDSFQKVLEEMISDS